MNSDNVRKVIIIGSGPAGYAAGVYTSRGQLQPLMLAGETAGGQLMFTTDVENYAGFPQGILGPQLMMDMRAQAERFGTEMVDRFVTWVDFSKRPFRVGVGKRPSENSDGVLSVEDSLQNDDYYLAESVILATGASSKMLGIPGEQEYLGRGVATCAVCDAAFYRNKKAIVVGGGDAAMEDTLALTKFATAVKVLVRGEALKASKIMQERVLRHEKVEVMYNVETQEVVGDGNKVTKIVIKDAKTGESRDIETDGFFLAIGHVPATGFLVGSGVELNEQGYVKTGMTYPLNSKFHAKWRAGEIRNSKLGTMWLDHYPTMTSVEGVFAAGDNVDFRYRQAMTAAGYGTMAALDVEKWLERR